MDFIEDLQIFGYLRGHSYRECWRWPREITTGDSCRDQAIEGGGDTWGALGETALGSWSQHSNASGAGKWRHSVAKVVLSTPQYPRKIMENPYFSTIKANLIWYVVILRLLETSFFFRSPRSSKDTFGESSRASRHLWNASLASPSTKLLPYHGGSPDASLIGSCWNFLNSFGYLFGHFWSFSQKFRNWKGTSVGLPNSPPF